MKIVISPADGPTMAIPIPDFFLTSPTLMKWGLDIGRSYAGDAMPEIPPESLKALSRAIKQTQKRYAQWELVHVESGDNSVTIYL